MKKAFSKWSFSVAWMELGQISLCLAMKNEQPPFSICSNSNHQLHYHLLRSYLLKLFVVFVTLCGLRIFGFIILAGRSCLASLVKGMIG